MGLYIDPKSPYWQYNFKLTGQKKQQGSTKVRIYTSTSDKNQSVAAKKEAERIMNERITEFKENKDRKQPLKMTVKELIEWANTNYWKYEKWENETRALLDYFGEMEASDVNVETILKFRNQRLTEKMKKSTINRELALLKAAYNYAINAGTLFDNPVKKIKFYDCSDNRRDKFLKPEHKTELLNKSTGILQQIILFALKTGMRQGEILNLKWEDVDVERNVMKVISRKGNKIIIRHVPIFPQAKEILEARPRLGDYVFCYEDEERLGDKLSENGVVHSPYKRLIKDLNIFDGDFRFHDLRHTFASDYLMMRGSTLAALQDILGHRKADTTRRYAHLSKEHLQVEINRLPYEKFYWNFTGMENKQESENVI